MYSNTRMFNSHTRMPEICSRPTWYNHCPYAVPPHSGSSSPLPYAAKAKGLCKESTKLSRMMPSNMVSDTTCFLNQSRFCALPPHFIYIYIYIKNTLRMRAPDQSVCLYFQVSTIYTVILSIFNSISTKVKISVSFKAPNEQLEQMRIYDRGKLWEKKLQKTSVSCKS